MRGEKLVQLAEADRVVAIAQLLEDMAGVVLVAEHRIAGGRLALDDRQRRVDPFLPLEPVLLGLGAEVIDVIEHHLIELADPRVEVAGDGDVEDQGQAVPPRAGPADTARA